MVPRKHGLGWALCVLLLAASCGPAATEDPKGAKASGGGLVSTLVEVLDTALFGDKELVGNKQQAVHIIGAGLPRTGTDSMRLALEELGYHPHHMSRLWERGRIEDQYWVPFLRDVYKHSTSDVRTAEPVMEYLSRAGYNATLDAPSIHIFPVLMTRYPNSKVILTVRDRPRDWALSVKNTLFRLAVVRRRVPWKWIMHDTGNHYLQAFRAIIGKPLRVSDTVKELEDVYKMWENIVRAIVPRERLLIHNAKQGWGPICAFLELGSRCPKTPYPKGNDGALLVNDVNNLEFVADLFWEIVAFGVTTVVLVAMVLWWLCCGGARTEKAEKKE